jgi:hypothetical protein
MSHPSGVSIVSVFLDAARSFLGLPRFLGAFFFVIANSFYTDIKDFLGKRSKA